MTTEIIKRVRIYRNLVYVPSFFSDTSNLSLLILSKLSYFDEDIHSDIFNVASPSSLLSLSDLFVWNVENPLF